MKPTEFLPEFDQKDSGEYNDEAGMALSNLETICRSARELEKHIDTEENLPEWCQEKLAVVKGMLVAVTDYMVSQDALDAKQDDFSFNTDRIAEQLNSMLEGGPYDLPGKDYDRPGDIKIKQRPHMAPQQPRHPDDPDFMDPDQRRLRADQARVKKAQDEYHAKKKSGMAEGEIEKTPTGIIHRAEKRQPSRAPEMDRLDKGTTNNLDKGLGVHWDKTPGRGRHGIIDPTVDEQGVAEEYTRAAWKDEALDYKDFADLAYEKLTGAYGDKRRGIAQHYSRLENRTFGSTINQHGYTQLLIDLYKKANRDFTNPQDDTDTLSGTGFGHVSQREQGVAERITPPGKDDMEQYRKDTADMAKRAIANKTPMSKNPVNEFAGGMGASSVASAPGVGKGPKVGSLFGGSYAPKTPFNKKRKR